MKFLFSALFFLACSNIFCMDKKDGDNSSEPDGITEKTSTVEESYDEEDLKILADRFSVLLCKVKPGIEKLNKRIRENHELTIEKFKHQFKPAEIKEIMKFLSIDKENSDYDAMLTKLNEGVAKKIDLIIIFHRLMTPFFFLGD